MTTKPKSTPGIDAAAQEPAPEAAKAKAPAPELAAFDALRPNCGTCECSFFPMEDPQSFGECRNEPPKVQIVLMPPNPLHPTQGPTYQPLAAWPIVRRDQWCTVGYQMKRRAQQ